MMIDKTEEDNIRAERTWRTFNIHSIGIIRLLENSARDLDIKE